MLVTCRVYQQHEMVYTGCHWGFAMLCPMEILPEMVALLTPSVIRVANVHQVLHMWKDSLSFSFIEDFLKDHELFFIRCCL